ncbi:FAD-dependent oxidoreductase [Hankyongella ginsenosidimutans]|uniref:FAD-dependent oxidoreductase n=1 Tax=Hankyongella ginsenosidimutans TaxID=1763828 RepID=UPI00319DEDD8
MALNVAIVGSGPAGYYTAEGLIKQFGDTVCIDIIDRLPTPFGLIRAGVAPDHQSIKAVARRFEEQHGHPGVRFIGNVELGRDIAVADLTGFYDAVVIATGAPRDRPLGIEGEGQKGVLGRRSSSPGIMPTRIMPGSSRTWTPRAWR